MPHFKLLVTTAAVVFLLSGCGGGETSPGTSVDAMPAPEVDAAPPPLVRVTISPTALLFTAPGQEHALTARVTDDTGQPVAGVVTWTSSDPAQVTVSPDGLVRSVAAVGSAQITAEAAGARSAPLSAIVVEAKAGALLVTDAQVMAVGAMELVPGGTVADGGEYEVSLKGVAAPALDTVVLAAESASVAGKVVASRVEGDLTVVRLRFTGLSDLFDRYSLALSFRLEDLEMADDEAAPLAVGGPSGFRPARPTRVEGKFPPNGPLQCSYSGSATLSKNLVDMTLSRTGKLTYENAKNDPALPAGYLLLKYEGEIALAGSIGLKAEASFDGSAKCEFKKSFPIPVTGFLAVLIAPAVPIGISVGFKAKLLLASLELTMAGKVGVKFDLSVTCGPGDAPCVSAQNVERIDELKPKVEVPRLDGLSVDLTAEVKLLSGLDIAFLLGLGKFSIVEFKIGPEQKANLAFINSQGNRKDYASNYQLAIGYTLGLAGDVKELIARLGGGLVAVDVATSGSVDLAKSPTGTFTVDKPKIAANQTALFTTTLTHDAAYWILGYNVESVMLYRKKKGSEDYEYKATIEASPNQTKFDWQFRPTDADFGEQEFFAFVKTKFPLIELEVGNDTAVPIEVLAICAAGPVGVASPAKALSRPASACGGTLKHTTTDTIPFIGTTTETITANVRLVKDDILVGPGIIGFRPSGTFSYERSGTIGECTLRIDTTTGMLAAAPYSGGLLLYNDDEPYAYDGAMSTGAFTVTQVTQCPGDPPQVVVIDSWDISLFMVARDQGFDAGPDGKTIRGSYQELSETRDETWEWDLTLD